MQADQAPVGSKLHGNVLPAHSLLCSYNKRIQALYSSFSRIGISILGFLPDDVTDFLDRFSPPMVPDMAGESRGKLPTMGLIPQFPPQTCIAACGEGFVLLKPPLIVGLEQFDLAVAG
jgi:hypothetical protein